jgi:hypothetical protein
MNPENENVVAVVEDKRTLAEYVFDRMNALYPDMVESLIDEYLSGEKLTDEPLI